MNLDLRIQNNTLSASHEPLVKLKPTCRITADTAAASGSATVDNPAGFAIGQTVLIGNFGEPTAEIIAVHASTAPTATVLTFAANTVYDHYMDTPITVIDYDHIEFSKAATLTGTKTVLATPAISANKKETTYSDITDSTGYAFFRYKISTATYSSYSDGVPFTTNPDNTMEIIATEACAMTGVDLFGQYAKQDQLLRDANECQTTISEARDWVFELTTDESSVTFTQGENTYGISTLISNMKYPLGKQGIMRMMVGNYPLQYIEPEDMDGRYQYSYSSTLYSQATVAATSVTLVNSDSFPDSGSVDIGENIGVTYTANDKTTNVLSGIPASGTGSISTTTAAGRLVIMGKPQGAPQFYTMFNGNLITDVPADANTDGVNAKIKYLKKLPDLTSFASTTIVPFYRLMAYYLAYKIEQRKRNYDEAQNYLSQFGSHLSLNAEIYKMPSMDYYFSYILSNTERRTGDNRDNGNWLMP